MDFAEVIRRRRMVRAYRPDPVDAAVVERLVDTARRAPSAGFSQPHRFVVITSAEGRQRVADACGEPAALARGLDPWLSVAPVHIIPCVEVDAYTTRYRAPDKGASRGPEGWQVPYWWVDGGAGVMLLLLAAVDAGLGAGFLDVDTAVIRAAADVPQAWTPLGLVTVGHPAQRAPVGSATHRDRLALSDVLQWTHGP